MILVIAEKPSVSVALATVLGVPIRCDGYIETGNHLVSWCIGHLLELAPPDAYDEKYAKWRYDDLPIIPEAWEYVVSAGKEKQMKTLVALMKRPDVDTIVNACDAGREGELIFRLAYEHAKCKKKTLRLWISSMEDAAIRAGFAALRPGEDYDALYQSALCRARADWLVGMNQTRCFSLLYGQTLAVGRVQTPTLALLTRRESEIQGFTKESFFTLEIDVGSFTATGEKVKDTAAAEAIRAACDGKTAVIASVSRQEKTTTPPKLYDLTTLQREANRLFGYTAQQTLDYAQALYEHRLISYPRTDSRYLTEDMAAGLPALTESVAAALPFVSTAPAVNAGQVVNSAGVSDHHAIIPTPSMPQADLSSLPGGERNILYMLAVRLLCAVGEKHTFAETVALLDCETHIFTAKGKMILAEGWKAYDNAFRASLKDTPKEDGGDMALPDLFEGQAFPSVRASVKEGFTSPPRRYTEDSLLAAMECAGAEDMPDDAERKGLGTPATRAGIIEKLVKSGFVERKQKNLVPTEKGVNLITVLPDALKSPTLTAEWEHRLKEVERGELAPDAFMTGIADFTAAIIRENSEPNPEYAALFPPPAPKGEVVGGCPRCGQPVREGTKGFFCDNRACSFALWKDNRFFAAKKKTLDKKIAAALLSEGRVFMSGLYSEKTGKTYDATVLLDDTGGKADAACRYVNFKLEFQNGGER